MKFKYKKFRIFPTKAFPKRKYLFRPIIPIVVNWQDKKIGYEVLLDSGADFSIFHAEIGEILGIPIKKGKKEFFGGIVGEKSIAYVHKISIIIGGNLYSSIPIGFSYDISPHGYGILGQWGLFDLFRIIFDLKKEQIELRPKRGKT